MTDKNIIDVMYPLAHSYRKSCRRYSNNIKYVKRLKTHYHENTYPIITIKYSCLEDFISKLYHPYQLKRHNRWYEKNGYNRWLKYNKKLRNRRIRHLPIKERGLLAYHLKKVVGY